MRYVHTICLIICFFFTNQWKPNLGKCGPYNVWIRHHSRPVFSVTVDHNNAMLAIAAVVQHQST
jgi:hypothetical protein